MVDLNADHAYGHGFDRRVCEGCPKKTKKAGFDACGICGCPFATLERVEGGSPPSECPRLDEHYDPNASGNGGLLDRLLGE